MEETRWGAGGETAHMKVCWMLFLLPSAKPTFHLPTQLHSLGEVGFYSLASSWICPPCKVALASCVPQQIALPLKEARSTYFLSSGFW